MSILWLESSAPETVTVLSGMVEVVVVMLWGSGEGDGVRVSGTVEVIKVEFGGMGMTETKGSVKVSNKMSLNNIISKVVFVEIAG